MSTLGASLVSVAPGAIDIALEPTHAVLQQHGFVHGGAVASIADAAAGYAALSLMPPDSRVLTVEFKINFIAPAVGDRIIAQGRVIKAGRALTIVRTDVIAEANGQHKRVALLTGTMMAVEGGDGLKD